jgi:hypothetical protein
MWGVVPHGVISGHTQVDPRPARKLQQFLEWPPISLRRPEIPPEICHETQKENPAENSEVKRRTKLQAGMTS